jgi:selenocysteine lyase/cysteine desulfurase
VCKRTGAEVEVVPDDEDGQLDVRALERMLDQRTSVGQLDLRTKLVAVTHIPTSTGLVNPAVEIGQVTRRAGVLYLLDACQRYGIRV